LSNIEKSLESKSQSISDWWNCVPSLDKLGVSGTLLVRLSDAVNEVKKIKKDEYAKLLKDLEFDGLDSVSYEYGLKKGKEEASNVFLPEQGKNKHEIEVLKIELKRVSKLYNSALLSVPVSTDSEIEKRVCKKMVNDFKFFLKKHEVLFFGCDCSDCKVIEDDFEEKFLVKSEVQKE